MKTFTYTSGTTLSLLGCLSDIGSSTSARDLKCCITSSLTTLVDCKETSNVIIIRYPLILEW